MKMEFDENRWRNGDLDLLNSKNAKTGFWFFKWVVFIIALLFLCYFIPTQFEIETNNSRMYTKEITGNKVMTHGKWTTEKEAEKERDNMILYLSESVAKDGLTAKIEKRRSFFHPIKKVLKSKSKEN